MIEYPEARNLARQIAEAWSGRTICQAAAGESPHGFAWYWGDPSSYGERLKGVTVMGAESHGGHVWIRLSDGSSLIFGEGANLRLIGDGASLPSKRQFLAAFDDGTRLVCTVQMYAFLLLVPEGCPTNPYMEAGLKGPDPLSEEFTFSAFLEMARAADPGKLSAKGLLAADQRIPGLGNGCLQDILLEAGLHPKTPVKALSDDDLLRLHSSVVAVLREMTEQGGRDTEKDLYGKPGGYRTILSRNTLGRPCPRCGEAIRREAYMGGSIYTCPGCQPLL